ncbi:hypothetical protein [Chondromyces apiculatus]|uniref:Uncharacterized protein n=1 Tax=Chondromyces apiculatus DSM 436 TaxID=1192034 RepID=A0A017TCT6_9BACT|nr:hypothetical protein [Chondromyces apiculatus]EYF07029.1 Hypothetical protein CAP_1288 [Chondromyces apiculatus DSM 436]
MIQVGLDPTDPLGAIDEAFHEAYAARRAETLERMGPLVANIDDSLVLRLRGKRFEGPARTRRYHDFKAMSHLPLAVYLALSGVRAPLDEEARARIEALRTRIVAGHADAAHRTFTAAELPGQLRLFEGALAMLDRALADAEAGLTRGALIAYVREQMPVVLQNLEGAARDQLDTMHATMERWRSEMTPEEHDQMLAVVAVSHAARLGNAAFQYFSVVLGDRWEGRFDQEDLRPDKRVLASEATLTEESAFELLATHALDGRVGAHFFGDEGRLDRDVFSDMVERLLVERFGKKPAPTAPAAPEG